MILRSCLDSFCKQVLFPRPVIVVGSQTALCYSKSKSKSESELTPPPPKRNKSAWNFFFTENYKRVYEQIPKLTRAEIFSQMGQEWLNLDKQMLEKYNHLAAVDKVKYLRELEEYKASLSDEDKLALARKKSVVTSNHKKLKALGMPKKPLNAYIIFSLEYGKKHFQHPKEAFSQGAKLSAAWADLSSNERSKYVELAAAGEKEYRKKLEQWEAEMTAKGHIEIIDTKSK